MTFLAHSQDALIGDAGAHQLMRVTNVSGEAAVTILARQADGIPDAVAVAAAADHSTAVVAGPDAVAVVDLTQGTTTALACQCVATTLAALRGRSVFRLNEPSDRAITLLNNDGAKPVVEIIPPEPAPQPRVISNPTRGGRQ